MREMGTTMRRIQIIMRRKIPLMRAKVTHNEGEKVTMREKIRHNEGERKT